MKLESICGKRYRVFYAVSNTFEDYRIATLHSIIIYQNGLVYDQGDDLDPHSFNLFFNIEHYKKQYGSNFVGLEFQSEEYTSPLELVTALLKDNRSRQEPVMLADILEKIADLFVLFTDLI